MAKPPNSAVSGSVANIVLGMDAGRKGANTAGYVLIGKVMSFLMTGIALIIVTHILGPTQYGVYTLAVAFASIFGSIGYFGIGTALDKFISEFKQRKEKEGIDNVVSNALFMVVVSGAILTLLCFAISESVSSYIFHSTSMSYVIQLVSFYIVTSMLFGSVYDTLLGFGQGKHLAVIATLGACLQAGISIILAFAGFGALAPIFGLIVGFFVGFAIGIILVFRYNNLKLRMPSSKYLRKIFAFSFPVAMSNISGNLLGSFGLVFLGYFVVPSVIGNIGTATRTSALMSIIFDSITFALLPAFSAVFADKKLNREIGRFYGYVVYLAIALVSPMLFYMALFSMPFSLLVFGSGYTYSPLYISIMSMGLLIGIAGTYASTLLVSANKVKLVFKYNIIVNVLVLGLFLALVPRLGAMAYIWVAFILSPLIADILFIREISQAFTIRLRVGKFVRLVLANIIISIVAAPLYLFLGGISLLVCAGIVYLTLYPLLATLLRGADKGDIETIRELSKGVPFAGKVISLFMDYAKVAL